MYKVITPIQLTNGLFAHQSGQISYKALRVYLACFELVAIREAAKRSKERKAGQGVRPRFRQAEILRLLGTTRAKSVAAELKELRKAGLLACTREQITFTDTPLPGTSELLSKLSGGRSPARPIPVPRRVIRFAASCSRPGLLKTMLAYVLRGLSIERKGGAIKARGSVKAAWIAGTLGLSVRSVRAARAELIALGWITRDEASTQWKLNRTGSYFEVNLEWKPVSRADKAPERAPKGQEGAAPSQSEFAPPQTQKCGEFAPPYKDKKTLLTEEYKNQKTRSAEPAGFCKQKKQGGEVPEKDLPNIRNIKLVDLKKPKRLELLYQAFIRAGEIIPSEAMALNFTAAAVRAGRLDLPEDRRVKVFLGIIKRRLWGNITQAEEDKALTVIRRLREEQPGFLRAEFLRREAA